MVVSNEKRVCTNPGCKISEGGSCLESIDVTKQECPHYKLVDANNPLKEESTSKEKIKVSGIELYHGSEMTFAQTSIITNNCDTKLIAIVGESKSGKTTLFAEYFINFQKGPFGDYCFAGSHTLIGLEKRCFYATVGSRAKKPDTERTQSKEFSFLHLAVKKKDNFEKPPIHFLFSDISGERFRDAKTSTILMQELKILKAADYILFIIDGERLADKSTRAVTIEDAKTFIRKALDEKIFGKDTRLKIAISKWDYIYNDTSFNFEEKIVNVFKERFESGLANIEFTKLAARSKTSDIKAGMGLNELLNDWEKENFSQSNETRDSARSKRAFDNFMPQ
jgi:hypothetical protein